MSHVSFFVLLLHLFIFLSFCPTIQTLHMGCFLPNIISHGISCDHFSVCVCMLRHTSISGVNFSSAYSTRKQAELLDKDGLCMCACVAGTFPIISGSFNIAQPALESD